MNVATSPASSSVIEVPSGLPDRRAPRRSAAKPPKCRAYSAAWNAQHAWPAPWVAGAPGVEEQVGDGYHDEDADVIGTQAAQVQILLRGGDLGASRLAQGPLAEFIFTNSPVNTECRSRRHRQPGRRAAA